MNKFFIYIRKSTDESDKQVLSLEAQETELLEFAQKDRLEVAQTFRESQTAKEPGRPVFNRMLEQMKQGKAQGILAWHPDRLARNSVDGGKIIHLIDTEKILVLKFPTFWFEATPQGKFMLNIAFVQSKLTYFTIYVNVLLKIRIFQNEILKIKRKKGRCEMMGKKVIIVNEGTWGGVKEKTYDMFVSSIKRALENAVKKDLHSGKEKKKARSVIVVNSTKEAMEKVEVNDVDILIFNSRSMIPEARKIKKEYRRLKVLVLTGLIPDNEVVFVDKGWISSMGSKVLQTIAFD